jgi:predicted ATPase/class 3 adenylate cyclase
VTVVGFAWFTCVSGVAVKGVGVGELPSGTVTFLFTDLEGSTRLWEEHPDAMRAALARHDEVVRHAIEGHDGFVVKTTGDGFHAAFGTAHDAVDAAVAAQLALGEGPWEVTGPLKVRMGLHTCEAELRDGDYYGSAVNRAARLMSVAHGGQVVASAATSELVRGGSVELVDLGEHRLRDLTTTERVLQVHAPGLTREFPPLRTLDALPGNLPRQVTTFVGREAEIASLAELVRDAPLVTLTGVGGVGKTRLALQVATEVVARFPDGAWLCEFASVTDRSAVWDTLAASLRVQPFPGRSLEESALEYLTAKRLLLVLDNCEHLLDAIAGLVDAIARRCPHVSVLATSREGLALAGERIVAVPTLGVPRADAAGDARLHADAVQLFADRAAAAQRDFALTDHNIETVAVLCRRLDGIPLAIELAAARVRSMSPEDLVARLDQRFKLLTRGSRAALERHQTLRSTIDWSYDLLDPTERLALDRLSVFAGGCDLAAAEVVLAGDDLDVFDVDDVLAQLVDKSLVVVERHDTGVRYRLLETIRQYAAERLQRDGDTAGVWRGTPSTTPHGLRRQGRTSGAVSSSNGRRASPPTPTTSGPRSTGPSRPDRPTMRCAWSRRSACAGR